MPKALNHRAASSFRPPSPHTSVLPWLPVPPGIHPAVYKSLFYWLHSPVSPGPLCTLTAHYPPATSLFSVLECFRLRHDSSSGPLQLFFCPQIVTWLILFPAPTLRSVFSELHSLPTLLKMVPLSILYFLSSALFIPIADDILNNMLTNCIIWIPHTPSEYKLHGGRNLNIISSLQYPQGLEKCLENMIRHNTHLIQKCWMY